MPEVAEVRRRGFMVGIDLGEHDPALRMGHRVTLEARGRGAIVRPLGDTVVLMPPLAISEAELRQLVGITARLDRGRCAPPCDGAHRAAPARAAPPGRLSPDSRIRSVMDPASRRSRGVSRDSRRTPPEDAPREADLAFDQLYRSSRDDVYAYAAGLLRDAAAAEDVTATAFERAYRKRSRFDPSRGERARLAVRDRPQRRPRRAAPPRAPGRAGRRPGRRSTAPLDEPRRAQRAAPRRSPPRCAAWRRASASWSRSSSSPASPTPRSPACSASASPTPAPACTAP